MAKGKTKRQLDEETRRKLPQTTYNVVSSLETHQYILLIVYHSFVICAHEAMRQNAQVLLHMCATIVGSRRRAAPMEVCPLASCCRVLKTNILQYIQVAALGKSWLRMRECHRAHQHRKGRRHLRPQMPRPSCRWTASTSTLTPQRQSESVRILAPVVPRVSTPMGHPSQAIRSLRPGPQGSQRGYHR